MTAEVRPMSLEKRQNGRYFTALNPFCHPAFRNWARQAGLPSAHVLEPFAGANDIIAHLKSVDLCRSYSAFDVLPLEESVVQRDTLSSFPSGYDVCVTNPPWLAKNSATFRGLHFPECEYDDIYKLALERCLEHCGWVAALVPESFIRKKLFRDRLCGFVSLTSQYFLDTQNPVGLALFLPEQARDCVVWSGDVLVGDLSRLEALRPKTLRSGVKVTFNEPSGNVGLIAADNAVEASIRFCEAEELAGVEIKVSSRFLTKLKVEGPVRLDEWNSFLGRLRVRSHDVLLTSFKGIRKDGKYRRRLDYGLARGIIQNA